MYGSLYNSNLYNAPDQKIQPVPIPVPIPTPPDVPGLLPGDPLADFNFYLHPMSQLRFVNGNSDVQVVATITTDLPEEVIRDNISTLFAKLVEKFQATIDWGDGSSLMEGTVVISDGWVGIINDPKIAWGTPGLDNLKGGILNVDNENIQLLHGQPAWFNVYGEHTYLNPFGGFYDVTVTVSYAEDKTQSIVSEAEVVIYGRGRSGPQSNRVVLATIQPDSWGEKGPNQTMEEQYRLQERNNLVFRDHTFSGATQKSGRVRWPYHII